MDNPFLFLMAICWPTSVVLFITWYRTVDVTGRNIARQRNSELLFNAATISFVIPLILIFVVMVTVVIAA